MPERTLVLLVLATLFHQLNSELVIVNILNNDNGNIKNFCAVKRRAANDKTRMSVVEVSQDTDICMNNLTELNILGSKSYGILVRPITAFNCSFSNVVQNIQTTNASAAIIGTDNSIVRTKRLY